MNDGTRDGDDPTQVRCNRCKALLAERHADGLLVRRGSMQTCTTGSYAVSIVCYRCKTLNVVTSERK